MLFILIGYMWLFIHRPFEVWPDGVPPRTELLYVLMAGCLWMVNPGNRWLGNRLHWACFTFAGAVVACWVFSPFFALDNIEVTNYLKFLPFYVMLVTVVNDER